MAYQKVYMNQIFSSSLIGQLAYMWRKNLLCDAVIKTGNTCTKAHRLVMIAACPMLQHMENASLGSHLEVRLSSDVSQGAVRMFLQYLYEGYMKLTENNYREIEKIAKLLQVDSILKCCVDFAKCLNQQIDGRYGNINEFGVQEQQEFKYVKTTDLEKTYSTAESKSPGLSNKRVRLDSDDRHAFSRDYDPGYERGQPNSFSAEQYDRVSSHRRKSSQPEPDPVNYGVEVINLEPAETDREGWPIESNQPPIQHSMGVSVSTDAGIRPDRRVINITDHDVQVTSPARTKPSPQRSNFQSNQAHTSTSSLQTDQSTWQSQASSTFTALQRKTPPVSSYSPSANLSVDRAYAAGSASQMRDKESRLYSGSIHIDQPTTSTSHGDTLVVEQTTKESTSESMASETLDEFKDSDISIIKIEHIGSLPTEEEGGHIDQQETIYIQQVTPNEDEGTAREDYSNQSSTSTNNDGQAGTSQNVTSQDRTILSKRVESGTESSSVPSPKSSKTFNCMYTVCLQQFATEEDFKQHLALVKNHGKVAICTKCGKFFKTTEGHRRHLKTQHSGNRGNFGCQICGKHFLHRASLKEHMVTHSHDRPFRCNRCNKTYKLRKQVIHHIRVSHDGKPEML